MAQRALPLSKKKKVPEPMKEALQAAHERGVVERESVRPGGQCRPAPILLKPETLPAAPTSEAPEDDDLRALMGGDEPV